MEGKKFNNWTVLNFIDDERPGKHYECMCVCGNIRIKKGIDLRAGKGKQCTECQYSKMYDPRKEIGRLYGKWKIIKYIDIHRRLQRYEVECKCGFRKLYCVADLRAKKSTQCIRCHNRENAQNNKTHGMYGTKTYKVWTSMVARCNNPNTTSFDRYGGRDIKVCDRWLKFENFLEDMGERPKGLTLDRTNNDGNYEPGNCRWVTHKENCNNRSNKKKKS